MKTPYLSEDLFRRLYGLTALREHLPIIECDSVIVIVESFIDYKFLLLEQYGKPGEYAFVTGSCNGLPPEHAAIAEVRAETGYEGMLPPRLLGHTHEASFQLRLGRNQFSHHSVFFCRLTEKDPIPVPIHKGEHELHRPVWVRHNEVLDKLTVPWHRSAWIAWRYKFLKEA